MQSLDAISRNFRLLIAQVTKQLNLLAREMAAPDAAFAKSIQSAEAYIDTQKSMIEDDVFKLLGRAKLDDQQEIDALRAVNTITSNLERISDFATNITRQLTFLNARETLDRFDHNGYIGEIRSGVELIGEALFERDSDLALEICQFEQATDQRYHEDLQTLIAELRTAHDVDDRITTMFILHYLERMGDALLNIGEAIIFAVLGERLKVHQLRALGGAIDPAGGPAQDALSSVEMESIWGTRSGVRIGTLEGGSLPKWGGQTHGRVLFKEGDASKLAAEKDNLQRWRDVAPGLAPEVVEFEPAGGEAALLLQYLEGATYRDVLLNEHAAAAALRRVQQTVLDVWTRTLRRESVHGKFVQQMRKRLDDVLALHPWLAMGEAGLGAVTAPDLPTLIDRAKPLDASTPAPITVFLHGDFNLDNLIYNAREDRLHYIDVHRSGDGDYVQDVAVFLVSHYRQPIFAPRVRRVLEWSALSFLAFARRFAAAHGDTTFEVRLSLGLARSFTTSVRFELNRRFARDMTQRATMLLQRVLTVEPEHWRQYRTPDEILLA